MPWFRHYTLNIDNLDEVMARRQPGGRTIRPVSALVDGLVQENSLLSVHLNGRLADGDSVTFSPVQYGERLAAPDLWYQTLVADLLHHPVLFVGTELEEPGIWQHIEMRHQRGKDTAELRPPSYLVSPKLSPARAALLKRYNVDWIKAYEEEFWTEAISTSQHEAVQGHLAISSRHHPSRGHVAVKSLSEVRQAQPPVDLKLFLLGREPHWSDITDGYAIERAFDRDLAKLALEGVGPSTIVITGTAASGKSTSAMRLALSLSASGKSVDVLDLSASSKSVASIKRALNDRRPEVLLVDDIDMMGEQAAPLVRELTAESGILVIAAIRSSRLQALDFTAALQTDSVVERTAPTLTDSDIDSLISTLSRAHRLGRLSARPLSEQRRIFREQCGRQLLVGMFMATAGQSLQARVYSECEDLGGSARLAYGMAAIATAERFGVMREEVTMGISTTFRGANNTLLNTVRDLINRELLITDGAELRLRHRWIAETVLEFYQSNGLIGPPLKSLVLALAMKVDPQSRSNTRERKMLRRLMNHDYLQRLTGNVDVVREVYSEIEDHVAWDYHYWLQRGSLEVESGDLSLAENFLSGALALSPQNDFRVNTEYAYLQLKKAARAPTAQGASVRAEEALKDLEHAMSERGAKDSYVFHVYGSQGLAWARRAPLSLTERRSLLGRLLDAVEKGQGLHPNNRDLRQLSRDIKRDFLSTSL